MATTEGHYRSTLPFLLTTSSVINTSSGVGSCPSYVVTTMPLRCKLVSVELTERRIADRQPAAFTTQPFHAFFSAGTERRTTEYAR